MWRGPVGLGAKRTLTRRPFIHITVIVPNFAAVFMIRSKSLMPDMDGSATIKTISTPLSDAITGQPMPGEPSIIARLALTISDFICFLTSVTSIPEVPLPIFSCAVEKTSPSFAYNINSPATAGFKDIASTGQTALQTPQPSHAKGSTLYFLSTEIESNLQFCLHLSHLMHSSGFISAFGKP